MGRLREELRRASGARTTVLLVGETGTGKGHAARLLHRSSAESGEPFVHVDCASLSAGVIESELFGHERGAFTGAHERRIGRFERAGAGTVFLDEIGEIAPALQAKLLRVLQDREFERVGGDASLSLRARVVAATNRDLRLEMAAGRFRADLFYRLQVYELRVPPLRERLEDLPALLRATLDRNPSCGAVTLTRGFAERLRSHAWPGNVRELQNLVERLAISNPAGPWSAADADAALAGSGAASCIAESESGAVSEPLRFGALLAASRDDFEANERNDLAYILSRHRWNVSAAARSLRLSRGALRGRMARLGLSKERESERE